MARFVLVRHGQTEWNRVERFRGRADLALDKTGLQQAEAAGRYLKGWRVVALYSSPLRRALQTAEAISRHVGIPAILPLDDLVDIDYGFWQGLSPEEAAQRDPERYRAWLERPQDVVFPGGESLQVVRERAMAAVLELAPRYGEDTVLLVSHKVVCQVLLCALLGLDNASFWQVQQDVCAINIFHVTDGVPALNLVNDTCHLRDLPGAATS